MSDQTRNRGGFRLDDVRQLHPLYEDVMYRVSRMCGHTDEAAILRKLRVLSFWLVATAESAFEVDGEGEALDAIDRELAAIFGERGKSDAVDR
jgi:hypothetical protein